MIERDAKRYRWLISDADAAAQLVADTYTDWDTDEDWRKKLDAAIDSATTKTSSEGAKS